MLQEGWTALHCAAHAGYLDVAKLLVESGASAEVIIFTIIVIITIIIIMILIITIIIIMIIMLDILMLPNCLWRAGPQQRSSSSSLIWVNIDQLPVEIISVLEASLLLF